MKIAYYQYINMKLFIIMEYDVYYFAIYFYNNHEYKKNKSEQYNTLNRDSFFSYFKVLINLS